MQVLFRSNGEYIIQAAGEIHLQKCIEDLTNYFAPDVEIQLSSFVVPFRETVTELCTINSPCLDKLIRFSNEQTQAKINELVLENSKHSDRHTEHEYNITDYPIGIFQLPHRKSKTRVLIRVTAHPLPNELVEWCQQHAVNKINPLVRAFKKKVSIVRSFMNYL